MGSIHVPLALLIAATKSLTRATEGRKRFSLQFERKYIVVGKAEQQEQEAAGHIAARVWKQGVKCLCSVSFLYYMLPKTPALRMSLCIFRVGLLTSVNLVYISPPRQSRLSNLFGDS